VRRVLELKARSHLSTQPYVSLDALRTVVGSAEHRAKAADIAQRAITLLRDRDNLVPLRNPSANARVALVQYMPETELRAGRILQGELRAALPNVRTVKISPATSAADLGALSTTVGDADRVIVALYVRRVEGEGRTVIPAHIATWGDSLAKAKPVIVVANGNPYLIRQLPNVGSYLVTYGVGDALERAAGRALIGRAPIGGKVPVSLPGFFTRGEGLARP
jgi:beta-N-acetylhexosaminidase